MVGPQTSPVEHPEQWYVVLLALGVSYTDHFLETLEEYAYHLSNAGEGGEEGGGKGNDEGKEVVRAMMKGRRW